MKTPSRRWGVRLFFLYCVLANASVALPPMTGSPGLLDPMLAWNTKHVKPLFVGTLEWLGLHHRWWMMAHYPGDAAHAWYNVRYTVEVTDARNDAHIYTIPPPDSGGLLKVPLGLRHYDYVKTLYMYPPNDPHITQLLLWHAKRDLALASGRTLPFIVRFYSSSQAINPPGSLAAYGPAQTALLREMTVTARDLECLKPWPPHADY